MSAPVDYPTREDHMCFACGIAPCDCGEDVELDFSHCWGCSACGELGELEEHPDHPNTAEQEEDF